MIWTVEAETTRVTIQDKDRKYLCWNFSFRPTTENLELASETPGLFNKHLKINIKTSIHYPFLLTKVSQGSVVIVRNISYWKSTQQQHWFVTLLSWSSREVVDCHGVVELCDVLHHLWNRSKDHEKTGPRMKSLHHEKKTLLSKSLFTRNCSLSLLFVQLPTCEGKWPP